MAALDMKHDLSEHYETAQTGCVLIDRDDVGRVWSTGEHRIDLIHRMSTNDLRGMAEGEGRATVLTNANARIIDYVLMLPLGARALMLTSPGMAAEVRRWLSGYVFFQDDVTLTDASVELAQFGLYGARAAEVAASLAPGADALPVFHSLCVDAALVVGMPPLAGGAFEIIVPRDELPAWLARAEAGGACHAPRDLFEVLRVEAGLPGPGHEVSGEFIPLEVGLWDAVSFSKGCYIGQEIIARMESRGKLAKTLVGLRTESPLPSGAQLRAADGSRGAITSSVQSPRLGWLALGVIKPTAATSGTEVSVVSDGHTTHATIADLPFA